MSLHPAAQQRFAALVGEGSLSLPVLPEAVSRVLAMVEQPDCDARKLAELLRRDAALTAHVMRVAGSPLYAGATKVVSLQQVIGRLGFAAITQIALVVATQTRVFSVVGFEREVRASFRHSLASALFAQEIARLRRSVVDLAFLAGLLHDIGRPLCLQALIDVHRELAIEPDRDTLLAEADAAHARVGGALIEHWALPARIAEAVRRHHEPAGNELAMIVALGDRFAHALGGADFAGSELAAALNLYPDDVAAIARKSDDIATTMEAMS